MGQNPSGLQEKKGKNLGTTEAKASHLRAVKKPIREKATLISE